MKKKRTPKERLAITLEELEFLPDDWRVIIMDYLEHLAKGNLDYPCARHQPNPKQLEELTYDGCLDETGALTPKATTLTPTTNYQGKHRK